MRVVNLTSTLNEFKYVEYIKEIATCQERYPHDNSTNEILNSE